MDETLLKPKTDWLNVSMSPEQKAQIADMARKRGMNMAAFCRLLISEGMRKYSLQERHHSKAGRNDL